MMAKAYRYIRFSSQNQAKGSSLDRQLYAVQQWSREHPNIELSGEAFEDFGLSGYKGEHLDHAFGRLLVAIEKNKIVSGDYVLIEAVDRMGRLEPMEMLVVLQKIVKSGVSIVTLDDNTEYNVDSLNGGLLQLLIGKFQQANQYSKNLSRRIAESWRIRKKNAKDGKFVKMRTPFWLDENHRVIPEYAPIIKNIFEWYLLGDGQRRILRTLSEQYPEVFGDGFREDFLLRTKGNKTKKVNPGTIKKWLSNKVTIGYWGDVPKVYEPVIDEALFYKVQNALKEKTKRASKPQHYFIGGLAKCKCGNNLTFVKNTDNYGNVTVNGRCTKRGRLGYERRGDSEFGCDNSTTLPAVVIDVILHQCLPDAVSILIKENKVTDFDEKLHVIRGKIDEKSREISNLVGLAMKGIDEVEESLLQLNQEKKTLQSEEARLKTSIGSLNNLEEFDEIYLQEKKYRNDYEKFNRLLQRIGFKAVCDGKSIVVHIPNGRKYHFKYLKYDRTKGNKGSQQYHYICLENDKIISIPRSEPITPLTKKTVDISAVEDNIIMLDGIKLKEGQTLDDLIADPESNSKLGLSIFKAIQGLMKNDES